MRQVLINSGGALVARMPRPVVDHGSVLVRVRFSLISAGTELASLRPSADAPARTPVSSVRTAIGYLGKAARDPATARARLIQIARRLITRPSGTPAPDGAAVEVLSLSGFCFERCGDASISHDSLGLDLTTDTSEFGYQAVSQAIPVSEGMHPVFELEGEVLEGSVSIGVLDGSKSRWLGSRIYAPGSVIDRLIFSAAGTSAVHLVIANAGTRSPARLRLHRLGALMLPPPSDGLPLSELDQQGWNVGYSAAGEVVAVGAGVSGYAIGDHVACAGAGKANHADYVSVPQNLVCKVPQGVDLRVAAMTTVGSIALQGVRRAKPQIGETACIIGLGLIGQIIVQILRANGVRTIGLDLDPERVSRASSLGLDAGESDADRLKVLVRDLTGGRGCDQVFIAAATKSDAPLNLSMELVRAKGVVVVVGDVGLNAKREQFYRKEVDLLMSTSYGPGRYDPNYEEEGRDYPFAHVRWTMKRNMAAFLDLVATGRLALAALVDREFDVDHAPAGYAELAATGAPSPLAVLLSYPDDLRNLPEAADAPSIIVRGHRAGRNTAIQYALVGVGAFGTSMLVPQMARCKDRFFLRTVVGRNTTTAGNFARSQQVPVLATDIDVALADPDVDLVVLATRHHEHADQVIRCLRAGKHVFVEKPLALGWEELGRVVSTYQSIAVPPILMVGFNRRFSPAVQSLMVAMEGRRTPMVINYRVNAGFIPSDHWVQGAQGGGRNLGEACHMYDLFRFLVGSPATSIGAHAIGTAGLPHLATDNFTAVLGYADGSVANLIYTSLGPKAGLAKERIEVFVDGECYLLDDFRSLVRSGDGEVLWQAEAADKGHFEELRRLGASIFDATPAPISFTELVEVTATALHVEDLLHGRLTED
jgi:predicted dehydrogenase/threonine dehydrogenase-like Zn-dependent dehydrogenase